MLQSPTLCAIPDGMTNRQAGTTNVFTQIVEVAKNTGELPDCMSLRWLLDLTTIAVTTAKPCQNALSTLTNSSQWDFWQNLQTKCTEWVGQVTHIVQNSELTPFLLRINALLHNLWMSGLNGVIAVHTFVAYRSGKHSFSQLIVFISIRRWMRRTRACDSKA